MYDVHDVHVILWFALGTFFELDGATQVYVRGTVRGHVCILLMVEARMEDFCLAADTSRRQCVDLDKRPAPSGYIHEK